MKEKKKEFRNFYQEIIELFLQDEENIKKFLEKRNKSNRKTKKNYK